MKELVSVARTPSEKQEMAGKYDSADTMEDYPYGLSMYLDNDTIEKLKISDLDAEDGVMIHAKGMIREDSVTIINGKKRRSLSIQITAMCLDEVMEEKDDAMKVLYG